MNPQQKRSHVPKFGSWDSDNIPYTAYFENARKERGSGVMMNPNDPEENPEAFMFGRVGTGSEGHRRNTSDHRKSGTHKSTSSKSSSDKGNSENSLQQQNHRRARNTSRKKSITEANNFVPPSPAHDRLRSANNSYEDMQPLFVLQSYRSASVPKFGAWDEKDPKSGEGFTDIFNKVKQEKQIAATKFPAVSPRPRNFDKSQQKHTGSKVCLFPPL
ncbi:RPM1-interacting protein 4-like [Actinidia eriantha]|uniref:RPM1-interacting protein 4-like n=1 Tax=Actinidia eriantha TaxID=165200 RepID=UPI00258387B9|nr:RPM1-interacting protein 4-like [Actinidia eriantha]